MLTNSDTVQWTPNVGIAQPNLVGTGAVTSRVGEGLSARNNRHDNRITVARTGNLPVPAANGVTPIPWEWVEDGNEALWNAGDPTVVTLPAEGFWMIGAVFPDVDAIDLGVTFLSNGLVLQPATANELGALGSGLHAESVSRTYYGSFFAGTRIGASLYNPVLTPGVTIGTTAGAFRRGVYPRLWAQWLQPL